MPYKKARATVAAHAVYGYMCGVWLNVLRVSQVSSGICEIVSAADYLVLAVDISGPAHRIRR